MKIAFVSTILSYPWGGADALWTSAAEQAIDRGDRVLLAVSELTAGGARVSALVRRKAELFIRSGPGGPTPFWRRALRRLRSTMMQSDRLPSSLRAFAPDLVVISCGGTYDTILEESLIGALRVSHTPYRIIANLQYEHPSLSEADRQRARDFLAAADRIFFVSPRNLEITRRHLLDPLPNAVCIHGCRVHNSLYPASEIDWPVTEPWSLASVARLEPIKGMDLLIHSLGAALRDSSGWRLNVYGGGPQLGYLGECARVCGIGERVHFPGFVSDLDEIYRCNHMLVSSSLDEGVPMTIPEAMLRRRCVLATHVGGADEWIEHGRTGFICAAPTLELLTESLREAWEQRGRWRDMGEAAAVRTNALYRPNDFQRILS